MAGYYNGVLIYAEREGSITPDVLSPGSEEQGIHLI